MNSLKINSRPVKGASRFAKSLLKPVSTNIEAEAPDRYITALAHEIRNPLTNINLAVEILRSPLSAEEHAMYLEILVRSTTRINTAVTELLNYKQVGEVQIKEHSLHQLLDEAIATAQDRILLKKITVIKTYSTLGSMVFINKQVIKIALTNIIINAIEAMTSGKGRLTVSTRQVNNTAVIAIEDNGTGISAENLKLIFEPYFTKKAGGMGLGLSTSLKILRANKAKIAVKSTVGKGTRFTITFIN